MTTFDINKRRCSTCKYYGFCRSKTLFRRIFGCRLWERREWIGFEGKRY